MKTLVALLLGIGMVALAGSSAAAAATSISPTPSAVSLWLNYSDPASDVVKLWTVNMTPVVTSNGSWMLSVTPTSVNIRWIRSANSSGHVNLTFETVGAIANLDNTSYEFRLFTRADNASHYVVTYTNRTTMLTSNATGFTPVDISGNSTITAAGMNPTLKNALHISVAKSLLGTIETWNLDGTATQLGTTYSYRDFGWEVPGNPGSTPTPPPAPSVLPSWIWLAIVPVVLAIAVVIVLAARRKKTTPPPKQEPGNRP
ncbi:MAG TPA: hypothetical protein VK189_03585 [Thermoplasmata archaeon]|nr:hypothetical protein [Thermoplasmata archaeon]